MLQPQISSVALILLAVVLIIIEVVKVVTAALHILLDFFQIKFIVQRSTYYKCTQLFFIVLMLSTLRPLKYVHFTSDTRCFHMKPIGSRMSHSRLVKQWCFETMKLQILLNESGASCSFPLLRSYSSVLAPNTFSEEKIMVDLLKTQVIYPRNTFMGTIAITWDTEIGLLGKGPVFDLLLLKLQRCMRTPFFEKKRKLNCTISINGLHG